MTEAGLDIMKGHWLKIIRIWTVGFLTGVTTEGDSCLIRYSDISQCRCEEQIKKMHICHIAPSKLANFLQFTY